jgi:hypothetical protein
MGNKITSLCSELKIYIVCYSVRFLNLIIATMEPFAAPNAIGNRNDCCEATICRNLSIILNGMSHQEWTFVKMATNLWVPQQQQIFSELNAVRI